MRAFDGRRRSSDWQPLTLATGSGTARWRFLNGVVYVEINITGATVSGVTTLVASGGIPAAYLPSGFKEGSGRTGTTVFGTTQVTAAGGVQAVTSGSGSTWVGFVSYPLG